MDNQAEEEALVLGATSAFLAATAIVVRHYENRDAESDEEISQIPLEPHINRDNMRESCTDSVLLCGSGHCIEDEVEGEEEVGKEIDKQSIASNPEPEALKKGRKRGREAEPVLQMITTLLGEVVMAIKTISKGILDVDLLYQQVMNTQGFEQEFLGAAFDHLVEHQSLGKCFLVKNDKLRRIWLQKFLEKAD